MKKFILITAFISTLVFAPLTTFADETNNADNSSYTVAPVLPDKQKEDEHGYFKLDWVPGTKEKIGINITNNYDKDKEFTISVNKAITNANAAIVYDVNDQTSNDSQSFNMQDVVKFPETVTVPANTEMVVDGYIEMPNENLSGSLMGGVYITEKSSEGEGQVVMKYSYAYPVILVGNEPAPEEKIEFGEFKFVTDDSDLLSLITPINNSNANIIRDVSIDFSLKNENGEEVFGINRSDVIFTPETMISYATLIDKELSAGVYTVDLKVSYKNEKGESMERTSSQEVKVDKKVIEEIETTQIRTGVIEHKKDNSKLIIGAVAAVLIVGITAFVIYRKKSK